MTRFISRRIQRYSRCARKRKVGSHRYSTEHFFPPPGLGVMGVCGSGGRERERDEMHRLFSLLVFESSARSSARLQSSRARFIGACWSAKISVAKLHTSPWAAEGPGYVCVWSLFLTFPSPIRSCSCCC